MNISNGNFENNGSLARYFLGFQSQIPFEGKFSFNPCLIYSLKGWKFKSYVPPETGGEMNLHYLDLQIIGKYSIHKLVTLAAGVEIGTLIKTKRDPYVSIFDNFYKKNDLSLLIGFDYSIIKSVRIGFKYLHGLSYLTEYNITDINGNVTGKEKEGNLRIIQVGLYADLIRI